MPFGPIPSAKSQAATRPSAGAGPPLLIASSSATVSARLQTFGLSIFPFRWASTQLEPGSFASPARVNDVPASAGPPDTDPSTMASPEIGTIGERRLFVELTTLRE